MPVMPKSYIVFKWVVYSLATLLLMAFQTLVLNQIEIMGIIPFLYPVLPAVISMYEGGRSGPIFSLAFGLLCDLLLPVPFKGFFTIGFTLAALLSSRVAENFLSPGFLCGVLVSALSLALTGCFRIFIGILSGSSYLELMAWIALMESFISLPFAVIVIPLYGAIHKRCAVDY